jgi:hypothetical protein
MAKVAAAKAKSAHARTLPPALPPTAPVASTPAPEPKKPEPRRKAVLNTPVSSDVKKTAHSVLAAVSGSDEDLAVDRMAVMELVRTHAKDANALAILEPHMPEIIDTVIQGAKVRGNPGFNDRMTVFRMLGLPWTQTSSTKQEATQNEDGFANRLVRAVSRVEGKVRHATVTVDVSYGDDVRQPADLDGVVHEMGDPVRGQEGRPKEGGAGRGSLDAASTAVVARRP